MGAALAATPGGSVASMLVVAQVALSVLLVVAAALFLRTFTKLATLDLGFDADPCAGRER